MIVADFRYYNNWCIRLLSDRSIFDKPEVSSIWSNDWIFYGYLTPFTLIEAFAIFSIVTIRKHPKISEKCKTRIVKISNLCFGIYLVHILVKRILSDYLGLASTCFNASISVPLFAVLVFTVSCGVTWILRKIPYSKYFL